MMNFKFFFFIFFFFLNKSTAMRERERPSIPSLLALTLFVLLDDNNNRVVMSWAMVFGKGLGLRWFCDRMIGSH